MSIELDAWTALKTAVKNNVALKAYVKEFKAYGAAMDITQTGKMPILVFWPTTITDDEYVAFPKRKMPKLEIVFSGIIYDNKDAISDSLFKFDELIKNAIEQDIRLATKATIVNVGNTTFHNLSENVALLQIVVIITLPPLSAGSR